MKTILPLLTTMISVAFFTAFFILWLRPEGGHLDKNVPGMDGEPTIASLDTSDDSQDVKIGEFFIRFSEVSTIPAPENESAGWPRFRGGDFDNISDERTRLSDQIAPSDILWEIKLGEGHAAAAIYKDRVYVLDYMENEKSDALRCFSLQDGRELWRRWYVSNLKRNHGMSRTIPAVSEKHILSIGPKCHVMCVRREDGEFLWGKNLVKDFGTEVPGWYAGQCPVIDGDIAVIAPAGKDVLMFGADCESGEIVWKTPNTKNWQMSHSSIIPMTFGGKRFYVYCAVGGICGISAEIEDRGKILWETEDFNHKVIAPSPIPLDDGKILLTAGYGAGGALLQLSHNNGVFSVSTLKKYPPSGGISSEQQTPLLFNGYIFSIMPKDAGPLNVQFVCAKESEPDKILWSSGKTKRFGLGPYILANNKFFILGDDGILYLARASSESFQQIAESRMLDGVDAWGPIALSDGKMMIRDSKTMRCIDLKKNNIEK